MIIIRKVRSIASNLFHWSGKLLSLGRCILKPIVEIGALLAVIAIIQTQAPILDFAVDHQNKIIRVAKVGIQPVKLRAYAVLFSKSPESFEDLVSTRGFIRDGSQVFWWGTQDIDLMQSKLLEFNDDISNSRWDDVYCIVIDARAVLSNQRHEQVILIPTTKFGASMFGPMAPGSGMGGGYKSWKMGSDRQEQIKKDCLLIYDSARYSLPIPASRNLSL